MLKGTRVYPNNEGEIIGLKEGEYGKDKHGWAVYPPKSGAGYLTGPMADEQWTIEEHANGTITARPSIDTGAWHGYLTAGNWHL